MNLKKLVFLFLVLFTIIHTGKATHIVGGEFNYTDLGNGNYRLSLKVYRDCFNGVPLFDDPAKVNIFNAKTGVFLGNFFIDRPAWDTLPIILNDPCLIDPPNVCVEEIEYISNVNLPATTEGYILSYVRCCRNETILNLDFPGEIGGTYYCLIPGTTTGIITNSNPVFTNFPPVVICANKPIIFDHSAIDRDGDSLVYKLCKPFEGGSQFDPSGDFPVSPPFIEVDFASPYSLQNILGGIPLVINSKTGLLSGTPNTIGQFVVGVCVSEFRNGIFIGETKRDFQFNVADCQPVVEARFEAPSPECRSNTVQFVNNSIGAQTFEWNFGDGTPLSSLSNPSHTFPDTGTYKVLLWVNKGFSCQDSIVKLVSIRKKLIKADFIFQNNVRCIYKKDSIQFFDLSVDTIGIQSWTWKFGDGKLSSEKNPKHIYNIEGTYTVILSVIGINGCSDEVSKQIKVSYAPEFSLLPSLGICGGQGNGVALPLIVEGNNLYNWTPTLGLNNPKIKNPIANPLQTTTYTVIIKTPKSGGDTCFQSTSTTVFVSDTLPIITLEDTLRFCSNPILIIPSVSFGNIFIWSSNTNFTDTLNESINNPILSLVQNVPTKKYYLKAGPSNCFSRIDSVIVILNQLNYEFEPLNYCFGDSSVAQLEINYNGNYDLFWSVNGQFLNDNGTNSIVVKRLENGLLPFKIETINPKCIYLDSIDVSVKRIIINAVVDKNLVEVGESVQLNVETTSLENLQYSWRPIDLLSNSSISNPIGVVSLPVLFYVSVTNEEGCESVDSVFVDVKKIIVNCGEESLFLPNSFSPNGDGINDKLYIRTEELFENVILRVFNRWGELVFETNDQKIGWDGRYKGFDAIGDSFAYYFEGICASKEKIVKKGNITIIR